jgi:hypothetical protein
VEMGVVSQPKGKSRVERLGQGELHKGRRSGGRPLNKDIIQPAVSKHLVGVTTCTVIGT